MSMSCPHQSSFLRPSNDLFIQHICGLVKGPQQPSQARLQQNCMQSHSNITFMKERCLPTPLPLGVQLIGPTQWEAAAKIVTWIGQCSTNQGTQNDSHTEGCPKISHGHRLGAEVCALPNHRPDICKAAIEPARIFPCCYMPGGRSSAQKDAPLQHIRARRFHSQQSHMLVDHHGR